MLEAQQQAMMHLAARVTVTPRVLRAVGGETVRQNQGRRRAEHLVWAISWLRGRPLALANRRSRELLESFGRSVGELVCALADFDSPAIHRDFYWDLANGRAIVARFRELITNAELGATIDKLMAQFDRHTAPLLAALPRSAVHGDPNDYNVLVGGGGDVELARTDRDGARRLRRHDAQLSHRRPRDRDRVHDLRRERSARGARANGARVLRVRARSADERTERAVRARRDAAVHERMHRRRSAAPAARQRVPRREPGGDRARAADTRRDSVWRLPKQCSATRRGSSQLRRANASSRIWRVCRASPPCFGINPQREPSIVLDLSVGEPADRGRSEREHRAADHGARARRDAPRGREARRSAGTTRRD